MATTHGVGEKRVIFAREDVGDPVTQIACTRLFTNEKVEGHVHLTMDEYFFFLEGECIITIDGEKHWCRAED